MFFASDNGSAVPSEILAALARANDGPAMGYGADAVTARARAAVRDAFEAPEAAVHFVATGTAANALALATLTPPWGAVFCHAEAHVNTDECGAPEMFTGGAKLVGVPGDHGRMTPAALAERIGSVGHIGVHTVQPGAVSLTNVTEAGTVYTPAEIAALAAVARDARLPVHLDGARFANALVATGAAPAEMTWKAGVDILSLGGTKNGLLAAEAVVIFDPARAWEFELRRKRAGHLFSKMRYLAAQFEAWMADGLWLRLARQSNTAMARLAAGFGNAARPLHPVQANIAFTEWAPGTHARLQAAGAVYYDWAAPPGEERARLVTSWNTTAAEVDSFLAALHGA
jgi:threonine aldolase